MVKASEVIFNFISILDSVSVPGVSSQKLVHQHTQAIHHRLCKRAVRQKLSTMKFICRLSGCTWIFSALAIFTFLALPSGILTIRLCLALQNYSNFPKDHIYFSTLRKCAKEHCLFDIGTYPRRIDNR